MIDDATHLFEFSPVQ